MRLWVRTGLQITCKFGFSRAVKGTPDTSEGKVLYLHETRTPDNLFSGCYAVKKKSKRFPRLPPAITIFAYVAIRYPHPGWKILMPFLVKARGKACMHKVFLPFKIG